MFQLLPCCDDLTHFDGRYEYLFYYVMMPVLRGNLSPEQLNGTNESMIFIRGMK